MANHFKINVLAAFVLAAGVFTLAGAEPAEAAEAAGFDGCANMEAAITANQSWCESNGGTYVVKSYACSPTGYRLSDGCEIDHPIIINP